jgi:hypothetical protein
MAALLIQAKNNVAAICPAVEARTRITLSKTKKSTSVLRLCINHQRKPSEPKTVLSG